MINLLFLAHCSFEKTPTLPIIIFEIVTLVGAGLATLFLSKIKTKIIPRFLILALGVLIFELFTSPMWLNERLGVWAYLYHDVSWILTIGWTAIILTVVTITDQLLPQWKEWQRFPIYLGVLTIVVTFLEILVVNLGIRSYAPEVLATLTNIFVAGVPLLDVLYYTPVFTGLVISFYKYWSFVLDDEPLIPSKKRQWLRSIGIAFLAVFLFEVMIHPMVENRNLPSWSYLFFDISFLLTGLWVAVIGIAAVVVDRFFLHWPIVLRFMIALGVTGAIAFPIEAQLMSAGFRIYGESAVDKFTGFTTPFFNTPVEVAFAIPCYMALIIACIRYWETILDNRL
ncbi:hypothetical protein VB712_11585 [Spirulina sp. CCNP1310]|uniref:hypothetical protein n=1 Tax=Spirulina sp. CCNP1310 TaxID=3110249 RepID=UPI002B20B4EF|nr:hypothetical protein [Spirulina sp. CCNP1310]MEA5419867.1 hypothetical protein [Spirulina sp. CCNP1310]